LFEFQSSDSGEREASQIETDRAEAKRQRRASEGTENDFEEFVALLDQIQYMKTNHKNFGIWEEILMREDSGVKVMKSNVKVIKSKSFEWEDFSRFMSTHSSFKEEKTKQSIPANHFNMPYPSDDKRPVESFDLNVEAASNHMISKGF
jgi:hypothetical protein